MQRLESHLPEMCLAVPPLGSDILELAGLYNTTVENVIAHLLLRKDCPLVPLTASKKAKNNYVWVPGHGMDSAEPAKMGPRRQYLAAIVGQCLGAAETRQRAMFVGRSGVLLRRALEAAGLQRESDVYLTSILKTRLLVPKKAIAQAWIKQQAAITTIELILARPTYVLALGAKAMDFFFPKPKLKMASAEGRWHKVVWDLRATLDEDVEPKTPENQYEFFVMPCINPAALEYEQTEQMREQMSRSIDSFVNTVNGANLLVDSEVDNREDCQPRLIEKATAAVPHYPVIRSMAELDEVVPKWVTPHRIVAIDGEWQGRHPQNSDFFLRCVQFGWQPGQACVLHLSDRFGKPDFRDYDGTTGKHVWAKAFEKIKSVFVDHRLRVAGFYYGADHEVLAYHGLDLMDNYEAAETPELARTEGGFALELAAVAVDELGSINLETVRWRYTEVHDYFAEFDKFKTSAAAKTYADDATRENGYGWMPDEVLYPYAGGDADVTLQGALNIQKHLDADRFGNNTWLPYWTALRASPTVCEIMRTGMPFSLRRCGELALQYQERHRELVKRLRIKFNWSNMRPTVWQDLLIAMYGSQYADTDKAREALPPGVRTLALEPVITNGNRPLTWEEVLAAGTVNDYKPGTSGKALGLLINAPNGAKVRRQDAKRGLYYTQVDVSQELNDILYVKSIDKVLSGFTGRISWSKDNRLVFDQGYPTEVCDDGFLRCFLSQTKETGRWAASMPNLHNMPKRKEALYKRAMAKRYLGYLRTMMQAPPGYLIMEADYASAELFMLALAAGDDTLWDHCQRNLLPEDDPRFIDPHANLCVTGFNLQCAPNKTGLDSVGMGHLRNVAKCFAAGEFVGTDRGLITAELLAANIAEGEISDELPVKRVQSDYDFTPLVAAMSCGEQECVRVVTHIGNEIVTTLNHRHWVVDHSGWTQLREAAEIEPGECVWLSYESGEDESCGDLPEQMEIAIESYLDESCVADGDLSEDFVFVLGCLAASLNSLQYEEGIGCIQLGNVSKVAQRKLALMIDAVVGDPDGVCTPAADTTRTVYFRSVSLLQLVLGMRNSSWQGIPAVVLMWPKRLRYAYLQGFVLAQLNACREATHVRLPEYQAKRLQIALQSLGIAVSREGAGYQVVRGFDDTGLDFFLDTYEGNFGGYEALQFEREDDRIYLIAEWAKGLLRRGQQDKRPLEEDRPLSASRAETLHVLEQASQLGGLSEYEREAVDLAIDNLLAGLVPVVVSRVEPAGRHKTYDFETTDERNHCLIVNGIATHNSVIYGWAYGRGAAAIQLGAREEGIIVDLSDTRRLVDGLTSVYHRSAEYLEAAAARVNDGFLFTPMGRVRRCPRSDDRLKLSGYEREFKNSGIQGGVADVVNIAAYNLRQERKRRGMTFHIIMQIHDAFLFLVPYHEVMELANEVVPKAMCDDVPIIPFGLDGRRRLGQAPKYMGCNVDLTFQWGESVSKSERRDRLAALGIDVSQLTRLE